VDKPSYFGSLAGSASASAPLIYSLILGILKFCLLQEKIEFWSNVWGFSMEPIKELARSEPLVDTVSMELMTTSVARLTDIDINTMSTDDIPFSSDFVLKARRDDHMHAIVLWFDVFFGTSHKEVRLN
jgi:type I protein arginine methyltransferase